MTWKRGQSGNPGGRPKHKAFTDALRLAVNDKMPDGKRKLRVIADRVTEAAMNGESWACNMVADRLDGKPHQSMEMDHGATDPIAELLKAVNGKSRGIPGHSSNG